MSANNKIDDDAFLFAGQEFDYDDTEESGGVWRILIVDDEPEIHKVTQLALSNLKALDRRFEFLHAYSAAEAIDILSTEQDIAVILLDVVMETDDAGLLAVKTIREDLNLNDVRIILRTGQPGYAPEETVVIKYDINDYKTKTELTRNKLLTSVFSAIRSYHQLQQINRSKNFLHALNKLNNALIMQPNVQDFVRCLVQGTINLFGVEGQGLLIIDRPLVETKEPESGYWIANGTGEFEALEGQKYEAVLSGNSINLVSKSIQTLEHQITDQDISIVIDAQSCVGVLYLRSEQPIEISKELLDAYVSNIASDLDNILLLKRIKHIAYQDALTGLPNRTRFIQLLDEFSAGRCRGDMVVLLDLSHFSDINDGLGPDAGNGLLISVANYLQEQLPSHVQVCRVGADIYGLIGDAQQLEPNRLFSLFDTPFKTGEHSIPVNITLGLCRKLDHDKNGLAVLKHANIALNRAKKDLQSRYSYYHPEMEDQTSWRLGMIRRLTSDFKENKLQVWYQPQLSVETGKVIGMEALLRWPDGEGGFISPMIFIPLAEYSGLIVDIGRWVLEQSCQEIQRLKQQSFDDLRIAINVSMPQFRDRQFVNSVIDTAKNYDVVPSMLELEITESVVMDDPKLVVEALDLLKLNGFTIAIDDFGTGFSSLSYLHQLPLDRIKVDREFIKDIGEGGDGIIAETIIHLGQKLGLETIAEGIETEYQLNYVKQLGCDEVQGFYHAKPMPRDELEVYLKQQRESAN